MSEVKVSALPERLPWVEGTDYTVIAGTPVAGDNVRIRTGTHETFCVKGPDPVPPASPVYRVLSKTAFQDYAVTQLGGGLTGMSRFTQIMDATKNSTNDAVRFAFARYEAAMTFEKSNASVLMAVMSSDTTTGHLTSAEETAILDNWPEA